LGPPLEHRGEQGLPALVVEVDAALGDPGRGRHVLDAGRGVSPLREEQHRGGEDLVAPRLPVHPLRCHMASAPHSSLGAAPGSIWARSSLISITGASQPSGSGTGRYSRAAALPRTAAAKATGGRRTGGAAATAHAPATASRWIRAAAHHSRAGTHSASR